MDLFDRQVKRNLKGIELEKSGEVDKAIKLYELNIAEDFIGSHPYNRLAIIYSKRKQVNDEIRVLDKAIKVFSALNSNSREDVNPKLQKFKKRWEKANNKNST